MKYIIKRLFQKKVKLPVYKQYSKDWFEINYKVLKDNGVNSEISTIMMFSYNRETGPLLFEYAGDFNNVEKLEEKWMKTEGGQNCWFGIY